MARFPLDQLGIWPARISWFMLPVLAGPAVTAALDGRSGAVQVSAEVMMWAAWFAGMVCLLAPSTVSLTVYRIIAPASLVGLALTVLSADLSTLRAMAAAGATGVASAIAFLPITGDIMVNGSAYGPERRLALRPPASLLLGPIVVVWSGMVAAAIAGPLLLAARQWPAGALVSVTAVALAFRGGRSLHQLARRWIVFTPAGVVIHDYFVLTESILVRRRNIQRLGPAPAEPRGALDLSAGALGLALEMEAKEAVEVVIRDRRKVATTESIRLIFTPTLPGRLLREARLRGINVA
jgi:hypothetical protein